MLPEVQRLAADIESSNPADPGQQQALHERIGRLRAELERARALDLAAYLDTAAEIVQYLVEMGRMGPEQVLGIAAGLVRKVESSFRLDGRGRELPPAASPQAALPEPAGRVAGQTGCSPVEERMLGEVMLQLGFVTRKQLELGLVTQRATDLRIGEALVATGAATENQVKEALAVQQRLRWSPAQRFSRS